MGRQYFKLSYIAIWGIVYGAVFMYICRITVLLEQRRLNLVIFFSRYSLIGIREHIKKRPPLATTEKVQQYVKVGLLSILKCYWSILVYWLLLLLLFFLFLVYWLLLLHIQNFKATIIQKAWFTVLKVSINYEFLDIVYMLILDESSLFIKRMHKMVFLSFLNNMEVAK